MSNPFIENKNEILYNLINAGIAGGLAGMIGSFYLKNHVIDLSAVISQISYAEATLQPRLRSYPTLDNILGPTVMIILLGIIVAISPARKLRRFRPIDVLREV